MEIISFYSLNILVGAFLAVVLGVYGANVVARGKTMEIVLLGQTIQVGILLGVIVNSLVFLDHDDHGLHLEIIVSVLFTVIVYGIYERLTKSRKFVKTPVLVLIYTVLLAVSYLVVAASPLVESHMVKAFLGDIVTASHTELYIVLVLAILSLIFFGNKRREILIQSFDVSLFGHLVTGKGKNIYWFFNIIILCLMIYSIHVLGIVFTLCMMILPITIAQFSNFSLSALYKFIWIASPISVLIGFIVNIQYEQFPTSSLITLSFLFIGIIVVFVKKYL